jgi:hypothetical protein
MTPHPEREELMAWRDGEVSEARATDIGSHVESCGECRGFVEALATVSARLATWTPDAPSATAAPAAPTSPARTVRRTVLWAAAAVLVIGIASTVRVECAPAPTCDLAPCTWRFCRRTRASRTHPTRRPDRAPTRSRRSSAIGSRTTTAGESQFSKGHGRDVHRLAVPACRAAERAYGAVFADFERRLPGAVQVVIKDYPLNKRCNPDMPVECIQPRASSPVAVRLARERGTGSALIEWLFANQESLTPASVTAAAASVGKIANFAARCDAVLRDVAVDVNEAKGLEVGGTPTCFINGVLARNNGGASLFSPDEIRQAIEVELRRAR